MAKKGGFNKREYMDFFVKDLVWSGVSKWTLVVFFSKNLVLHPLPPAIKFEACRFKKM